ncbi:hypothetical protein DVH24_023121 [Malus domestica]|uniref:Uncharacterized protein n=1 Tax=Malus domestica TaxID=3750 RepID=A0A498KN61_MALDO|nr:hypothetical protein DVH24_023121 [Malus domestica]
MVSPKRTISCYSGGTGSGCGGPGPGCDRMISEPISSRKCADEDRDVVDPGRDHEAFWELTGFGFRRNFKVKRVGGQSTPRMGDPLRSCS